MRTIMLAKIVPLRIIISVIRIIPVTDIDINNCPGRPSAPWKMKGEPNFSLFEFLKCSIFIYIYIYIDREIVWLSSPVKTFHEVLSEWY